MTLEQTHVYPPFRVEFRPCVEGADPYTESKTRPPANAINQKAVLYEIIHLYEGQSQRMKIGRRMYSAHGFMNVRTGMYTDGEQVYSTFLEWGIKDEDSGEELGGNNYADPIQVYRMVKALESMPVIHTTSNSWRRWLSFQDLRMVSQATQREFHRFDPAFIQLEGSREQFLRSRRKMAALIGNTKLREILRIVPENIEEIIDVMGQKGLWVSTKNLERDLKVGNIHWSEYYTDVIGNSEEDLSQFTQSLEEHGWFL